MNLLKFLYSLILIFFFLVSIQSTTPTQYAAGTGYPAIACDSSQNGTDNGYQQCMDLANQHGGSDTVCAPTGNIAGVCRLVGAYCDTRYNQCYFSCQPTYCPAGFNGNFVCGVCNNGITCGAISPTPTQITPSPTPTTQIISTPTPTTQVIPTPTTAICVKPQSVTGIHITCPYCGTTATVAPTQ